MTLSPEIASLYKNIDYSNRYLALFNDNKVEDYLEKTDKKKVLSLFDELGYQAKYRSSEKFYQIKKRKPGILFPCFDKVWCF